MSPKICSQMFSRDATEFSRLQFCLKSGVREEKEVARALYVGNGGLSDMHKSLRYAGSGKESNPEVQRNCEGKKKTKKKKKESQPQGHLKLHVSSFFFFIMCLGKNSAKTS